MVQHCTDREWLPGLDGGVNLVVRADSSVTVPLGEQQLRARQGQARPDRSEWESPSQPKCNTGRSEHGSAVQRADTAEGRRLAGGGLLAASSGDDWPRMTPGWLDGARGETRDDNQREGTILQAQDPRTRRRQRRRLGAFCGGGGTLTSEAISSCGPVASVGGWSLGRAGGLRG
jgi:hypothetical protein